MAFRWNRGRLALAWTALLVEACAADGGDPGAGGDRMRRDPVQSFGNATPPQSGTGGEAPASRAA